MPTKQLRIVASAPAQAAPEALDAATRRAITAGAVVIAVTFGGFGAWAAFAPLESAVLAQGSVVVEGERKTVQHLEGGIISELRVKEGDRVSEGDVLVRLDETIPRAGYQEGLKRLRSLAAQEIRLRAERANLPQPVFDHPLLADTRDPEVRELIQAQRQQFDSQRDTLRKSAGIFEQRIMQLTSDIEGYRQQLVGMREQNRLYLAQLSDFKPLVDAGYAARPPLMQLQREQANVVGSMGDLEARTTRAKEGITENRIQIENLRAARLKDIDTELAGVRSEYTGLHERWQAMRDQMTRVDIRAPVAGVVLGLKFHNIGRVIRPGEPILDIVPEDTRYTIQARVAPQDIDIVRPGLVARVRFSAYNARSAPDASGTVTQVSADRIEDPAQRSSYYRASVTLDEKDLQRPDMAALHMYPGMPVEVYLKTGKRTVLQTVLVYFGNWSARGFSEK